MKPEGWLDDEPEFIPDPGESTHMPLTVKDDVLTMRQMLRSPRSGMTRRMVTGSRPPFATPSATRHPAAASGSAPTRPTPTTRASGSHP